MLKRVDLLKIFVMILEMCLERFTPNEDIREKIKIGDLTSRSRKYTHLPKTQKSVKKLDGSLRECTSTKRQSM